MKTVPRKLNGVRLGTERVARHYVRVVYTNMTEKSLTMSGTTGQARWTMCQFVWLVNTQIGYVSPSGLDKLFHHILK